MWSLGSIEEIRQNLKAIARRPSTGTGPGLDPSGLRWVDCGPTKRAAGSLPPRDRPGCDLRLRPPRAAREPCRRCWRPGARDAAVSYPELPGWSGLTVVAAAGARTGGSWREWSCRRSSPSSGCGSPGRCSTISRASPPARWCVADLRALARTTPRARSSGSASSSSLEAERGGHPAAARASRPSSLAAFTMARRGGRFARRRLLRRAASSYRGARRPGPGPAGEARGSRARPAAPRTLIRRCAASTRRASRSSSSELGSSLLVSTYQTGKLICARPDGGTLNTHFRNFERPMGLAVAPGRFAIGTRAEVARLPRTSRRSRRSSSRRASHDACFLPRTGTSPATSGSTRSPSPRASCGSSPRASPACTLDAEHSFVPRWRPPFITALAPEDRCHLNGLCVVDDEVRYVTALGETDTPGGWRENKAAGGVLIDVASGEMVLRRASRCPTRRAGTTAALAARIRHGHARGRRPRRRQRRDGRRAARLHPRARCSPAALAFVGLSQVRETATFGGLPLTERLDERLCGVWAVDTRSRARPRVPALRGAGAGGLRRGLVARSQLSGDRRGVQRRGEPVLRAAVSRIEDGYRHLRLCG